MTLKEAIRSQRPFKRPCWKPGYMNAEPYVEMDRSTNRFRFVNGLKNDWMPRVDDFFAEDYELMPDPDSCEKIVRDLSRIDTTVHYFQKSDRFEISRGDLKNILDLINRARDMQPPF